ncbi:PTS lactose/cellobiose transporter subunit IIA [Ileibacterium valens]|uniref:PTS lactose/cellobiose transporter subunit IIA n=1 Tax=Ileibacterium valens TaxID=1862668 RepID=UPI0023551778|nr:PTS lactose/cellobiose transporter subunit IIA [Ileibacterium valens]
MENMELVCFQIISSAGMAKSSFVEAIKAGEKGDFDLASDKIEEGKNFLNQGHGVHATLIQKEAAGEKTPISLLLLHAEDQMMSAELTELMASTILFQQKKILDLEAELSKKAS